MKKLSVGLISIILCVCLFMFVGCDDKSPVEEEPVSYYYTYGQLAEMEIGTEISIYPDCEFDYKLIYDDKPYTIHFVSISAQLAKKNQIDENTKVEGDFYPFEIHAIVDGFVPADFPFKSFRVFIGVSVVRVYVTQPFGDSFYFYGEDTIGVPYVNYLGFVTIYPE